jgi:hypothetical protein
MDCWSVDWAKDETAVSIVTTEGEVFIWRLSVEEPTYIGDAIPSSKALWSPDSKKLAVSSLEGIDDLGLATYQILFPDNRSPINPGASLYLSNGWEWDLRLPLVDWHSDRVLKFHGPCGVGCVRTHFLDAFTGEELTVHAVIRFSSSDVLGEAAVSNDGRWLVMDNSAWHKDYLYSIYDFETRKEYSWQVEPGGIIDFKGWAKDDSRFYLIRYPGYMETEVTSDSPNGLKALKPTTRQTSNILQNVAYGIWNHDTSLFFGVTSDLLSYKSASDLSAAIYTSNGSQITSSQPVADKLDHVIPFINHVPAT